MRKNLLTIAAIIIATVSTYSQSVTETRRIKTTALQMYENYKVILSGLYSKSAYTEDNFMALFGNTAMLYNDILPDNHPQQLSPANYFAKFKANVKRIYPVFRDFRMGEPASKGSKWQIKCDFVRETRFRTQKDMDYPEWSFNYTMTIEMDKSYNTISKVYENAGIVSIDAGNPLKEFFIIENKENIFMTAPSGETLNGWDKEDNSRIFPENEWKMKDIQITESGSKKNIFGYSINSFSGNQTDTHFYQPTIQKFPKNIFGIGVNYSPIAVGNKFSGENAKNFKDIEHTSNALSLSFFYGKQIAHREKSTLFFNAGLDLNMYFHKYSYSNIKDTISLPNYVDSDSYQYVGKIKVSSPWNENVSIISASVPLSVQYLYQLTALEKRPIFLSFELGVFAETSLYSSSKYNLNGNYYGLYTFNFDNGKTQEVEFDHYYNYGILGLDGEVKLTKSLDGGIFGGIGLWYALNKSNLIKINVTYKHGFNSPSEYKENYVISEDKDSYQSLLQSTNQGMRNIYFGISWIKTIGGNK